MTQRRQRHATAVLTGLVVCAGTFSLSSCGGGDDDSTSNAPTPTPDTVGNTGTTPAATAPPTETELAEVTLPSGATASYPSTWTSYGDGFAGNLELAIPQVVNISLRDAAASEYLYGPMLPDQESLDGAFDMFEFALGTAIVGERTLLNVDGGEVLMAEVDHDGTAAIAAVMASGDSYASVYAESLDGSISPDVTDAILAVLASITP